MLTDLIGNIALFPNATEYLSFCSEYLSKTLIALANNIQKDLLWKPMNYKLLMWLRSNNKSIRLGTIAILTGLFREVSYLSFVLITMAKLIL